MDIRRVILWFQVVAGSLASPRLRAGLTIAICCAVLCVGASHSLADVGSARAGRFLAECLDLSRPELSSVKAAANRQDWRATEDAWLNHARSRALPNWYWSHGRRRAIAEMIRASMPDAYREALADAETAMAHRFPHSCAPTVVRLVQLEPDFSFMDNPTGDRQFLYTLHRHLFWEQLGIAYLLDPDERYAQEWAKQLSRWLDEFPLPTKDTSVFDHDMWSGLDVGIRAYRWGWPYFCFLHSSAFTPEMHARWLMHWVEQARFLRSRHAPAGSNWCAMQMYGLLTVALVFPELKESTEWREYATGQLVKALRSQVRPDGVQVEQSPSYHVGCIRWFSEPMQLGQLNGLSWPEDYGKTLERMCTFTLWAMGPDGLLPALSDTDRSRRGADALAIGAMMFNRPDFAARAAFHVRHVLIHGPEAVNHARQIAGKLPAEPIRVFPHAGYAMMRSGWNAKDSYAVFDCGPRGGGHGHFDLLNIEIHVMGRLMIADPGRWWYDKSALRSEMLSTPAHNTISLDGQNHAPFERNDGRQYELTVADAEGDWLHLHGRHHAYTAIQGPPVCDRHVFYNRKHTWVIVDQVASPQPHDVLVSYLFATESVRQEAPGIMVAGEKQGPRTMLIHEARDNLVATLQPAILSRVYGDRESAVRLHLCERGRGVVICTAIHGYEGGEPGAAYLDVRGEDKLLVEVEISGDRSLFEVDRCRQ